MWKIKLVERGTADLVLLQTYNYERQLVGHGVVRCANQGIRDHVPVWREVGLMEETVEEWMNILKSLATAAPEAQARRQRLFDAIEATSHEFYALGIEMNHRYESKAILIDDEVGPLPNWPEDPILYYRSSLFPGS